MTDSEVFDMIADKELMERTVRCTDVAHPRHKKWLSKLRQRFKRNFRA